MWITYKDIYAFLFYLFHIFHLEIEWTIWKKALVAHLFLIFFFFLHNCCCKKGLLLCFGWLKKRYLNKYVVLV